MTALNDILNFVNKIHNISLAFHSARWKKPVTNKYGSLAYNSLIGVDGFPNPLLVFKLDSSRQ